MHALLLCLLIPANPVDTPREAEVKKELEKLQGIWELTGMHRGTYQWPIQQVKAQADAQRIIVVGNEGCMSGQIGIIAPDPAKTPKELHFKVKQGSANGQIMLGIYELEGMRLRVNIVSSRDAERPTDFTGLNTKLLGGKGQLATTVMTFERDAKATKEAAGAELRRRWEAIQKNQKSTPPRK